MEIPPGAVILWPVANRFPQNIRPHNPEHAAPQKSLFQIRVFHWGARIHL